VARTIEILKEVAPDFSEGRTGEKEELCRDIVKELEKREQKWMVALTSEQCKPVRAENNAGFFWK